MNPNYNLMRLANLYGGMNKFAAGDMPAGDATGTLAGKGPVDFGIMARELMKLSPEQRLKVLQQNPEMFNDADRAGLTTLFTEKPDHASKVLPELGKLNQAARMAAYKNEGAALNRQNAGNVDIFSKAYGEPATLGEKVKHYGNEAWEWAKENPWLAGGIGAGALGLGGLGAYYAMKDDEEEERKKSASFIDPYVAQVLAQDYLTKMAAANGVPSVAAGVTGLGNYTRMF